MRRLKIEYQPNAISDLREIYRYVSTRSQNNIIARDFVRRRRQRCSRIGFVPFGGRSRDDLEPGLRTVPFEHSAVIAYKIKADRVQITNVFHGGRDYEALYLDATDANDAE